jgi:hypothetical protein
LSDVGAGLRLGEHGGEHEKHCSQESHRAITLAGEEAFRPAGSSGILFA